MKTMVRQIILTGFVVFLPAGAQAQGRGGMPPVSHSVGVAPGVVRQAPHAGTAQPGTKTVTRGGAVRPRTAVPAVRSTRPQNTTRRGFDGEDSGLRSDCSSAPGLGFDAVHQAATCGSGTVGPRGRGLQEPFFFPFFDGGFSVPSSPVAAEDGSAAETPQPEATDAEVRETDRRYRTPQPVTAAAETASSAASDNEEFVFVRRDGTVFFAVAYAWEKGTLRYITSQGLRRTVTQDTLDLEATRQFNEQRGLNFHSPA
ncbi:MAG TPA: hypothetical protein VK937_00580 [Candidatus Limnocylindria bacterium]|nr:hypothetical protein [Candidatus Limnocylindria bacterium]